MVVTNYSFLKPAIVDCLRWPGFKQRLEFTDIREEGFCFWVAFPGRDVPGLQDLGIHAEFPEHPAPESAFVAEFAGWVPDPFEDDGPGAIIMLARRHG